MMGFAGAGRVLVVICAAASLAGCGGGTSPKTASGGLRFLVSAQDGLSQMTIGGSRHPLLTWNDQSYPLDPAISPDGKRLAFALQAPAVKKPDGDVDFGSDLYIATTEGKDIKLLVKHQQVAEFVRTPTWLSPSELLYTVRGRGQGGGTDFRIERLDLTTGKTSRFIDGGVDPATSRDGRKVAWNEIDPVSRAEALTVASVSLGDAKILADTSNKLTLFSSQVFSPDGTKVAFAAVDMSSITGGSLPAGRGALSASHPFAQDVWIVNADGTGLRRLAEIAENMPSLSWSGDGGALYALGSQAFWQIDPVSGKTTQIAQGNPQAQIVWLSGP